MEIKLIVALLLLVCSALADGTITTTKIDFQGTYQGDMTNLLTRVEKKVDVQYDFNLVPGRPLTQFPDMAMEFQLQFGQYVFISYHISIRTVSDTWMQTQLILDGNEDRNFRIITDGGYHHIHSKSQEVWLLPGKHFVKVVYNLGATNNVGNWDWIVAIFKIRYFDK